MGDTNQTPVYFEGSASILRVEDMAASLRFYENRLGFQNARWGNDDFTNVSRDRAGITSAGEARAAAERGSGSVWKTAKSSTRNTKRAE